MWKFSKIKECRITYWWVCGFNKTRVLVTFARYDNNLILKHVWRYILARKIKLIFEFAGNKAKERISKRVFQENKARQIFLKNDISYPLISTRTCAYQGVRNACFVFLKYPFWDSPFCLITDELNVFHFDCAHFLYSSKI